MRRCRIAKFILAVVGTILLVWILSPITIIPPANPTNPVTAYVLDQGLHAGLVLPTANEELIEYAYGDWKYFALSQQNLKNGLAALLVPTQGTIGRRQFSSISEFRQIVEREDYTVLSFAVAQTKAAQLLQSLNERFNRHIETRVQNPQTGLTLVHDDQDYTLLNNSNQEVAEWLENLNCQVKGFVIWANFRVRNPEN